MVLWLWDVSGAELMTLNIGYEAIEPWPLARVTRLSVKTARIVALMRAAAR